MVKFLLCPSNIGEKELIEVTDENTAIYKPLLTHEKPMVGLQ